VLLCGSAECEWGSGNAGAARAALDEAGVIAEATGAGLQSELGLALARTRRLLETPCG
jgi:hypothetical protein